MKRKESTLEKQLRKPEAPLPAGLRLRTLQRMGLRPSTPWYARTLVWAPALASFIVIGLVYLVRTSEPTIGPGYQQEAIPSSQRSQELAYASRHPGTAGPTTAMQVIQAQAMLKAEDAAAALNGNAVAVQSLPAQSDSAAGSDPGQVVREIRSAPASSDLKANGEHAQQEGQREPYRLTVKRNRIRPALNEKVLIELQAGHAGPVRMRIVDLQGRMIKDLVELADSGGPILAQWDGRDSQGQDVASGAYTIIIQSPQKTEKVGVLVIR